MLLSRGVLGRFVTTSSKQSTADVTQLKQPLRFVARTLHTPRRALIALRSSTLPNRPLYSRAYATNTTTTSRPSRPKAGTSRARPTATRKAAPKKKPAPKKKKAAAKKKPAPKKVLTAEQKARREKVKERKEIEELKKVALIGQDPKQKPITAWTVLIAESKGDSKSPDLKELANTYKNLSPSERENLNHTANQNTAANEAAHRSWIESHSAHEIKEAQHARDRLISLVKAKKTRIATVRLQPLKDQRRVKRPQTSFNIFFTERQESGDFKGLTIPERGKLVGEEWRALTQNEKQKYTDTAAADNNRYRREYKQVYGIDAPSTASASASATI